MSREGDEFRHEAFMRIAIRSALNGYPHPNPRVGCAIEKDGRILSIGWHRKFGGKHAEVEAIENAGGKSIKGATMYCTLEPCSHFGKTPPCTEEVIKSGIEKVVIGAEDPTEKVKGVEVLEENGIGVVIGIMEKECEETAGPFMFKEKNLKPKVVVHAAVSKDWKVRGKHKRKISGRNADLRHHEERAFSDYIVVGSETVILDNPRLNCRIPGAPSPKPIVLDRRRRVKEKHMGNMKNPEVFSEETSPKTVVEELGRRGAIQILIEGGVKIHESFIESGVCDSINLSISKESIGDGTDWVDVEMLREYGITRAEDLGDDWFITMEKGRKGIFEIDEYGVQIK